MRIVESKQIIQHFQEVINGLELHINKIGEYNNETVKKALNEDLSQLKYAVDGLEGKEKQIWRRFEVIKKENLAEAESLVESKQLSRQDLELLANTFRIKNT